MASKLFALFAAVMLNAAACAIAAQPQSPALARHRLMQQQLQDELALRLQQDMARSRPGFTSRDRHRLDDLALRQRIEQQQLEQEQLIQQRQLAHDPARSRLSQQIHAQERELQLQRFRAEQQTLLDSMRPAPLQPALAP